MDNLMPSTAWMVLAAHSDAPTLSALMGAVRESRDAVVQWAPSLSLTLHLASLPSPDTLDRLRACNRLLPSHVTIINDGEGFTPAIATNAARMMIRGLGCRAVTRLTLRDDQGDGWLVNPGLLGDLHQSLPGLLDLDVHNVTTPLPPHVYPTSDTSVLHSVRLHCLRSNLQAASMTELLGALGVRAGGSLVTLDFNVVEDEGQVQHDIMRPLLEGNRTQALRKLCLPGVPIEDWDEVLGPLILNAPNLEHLKLKELCWQSDEWADEAVPWRILEVEDLDIRRCYALPLGAHRGQAPLVLRVTKGLWCGEDADDEDRVVESVQHITATGPGRRRVRLEGTRSAYNISTNNDLEAVMHVLTLAEAGLSHLLLDDVDTPLDLKDLVDLRTNGLALSMTEFFPLMGLDVDHLAAGLVALPQVTKVKIGAEQRDTWELVDPRLLARLPPSVAQVCLFDGPSALVVAQMCVHASRVPHRQAHPLRLGVPGVAGWFDAAVGAIRAANISKAGIIALLF